MSNPAKAATQDGKNGEAQETEDVIIEEGEEGSEEVTDELEVEDEPEVDEDSEQAFELQVNKAVEAMKQDDKGVWQLPAGLPKEIKVAARLEKRRRDTQSDYTRTKQENKRLTAEKATLLKKAKGNLTLELTEAQAEELEELKFSDPEAWRRKMNTYEREAMVKQEKKLEEELKQGSTEILSKDELEERKQTLHQFNKDNPGFQLDDDMIANDIPPRIVKRLETGEVTFEVFLEECRDFIKTGKVVRQTEKVRKQPNLSKLPGGSTPDKNAKRVDAIKSYQTEVF